MLFKIINPSDPYTMDAPTYTAALAAVAILGEGRYGLDSIGHNMPNIPPILFGDWVPEIYEAAGIMPRDATGLAAWMERSRRNREDVAMALDSVRLGGVSERSIQRDPTNDGRTSLNDIGSHAWAYAKAMRGKALFAPIDAVAGNEEQP